MIHCSMASGCFCCLMFKETSIAGLVWIGYFMENPSSMMMDDLGLPPCQQTPESEDWILLQCKQLGEGCALAEECRSAEIIWNRCGKIGSWPLNIGFEWIWFINYSWCDDCIPSGIRSKERRCDLINNVWFLSKKWQHIQQIWTAIDPDGNPTSEPPHFGVFVVVYQLIDTPMSAYHPFPWNVGLIDPLHHGFWGCVWGVAEVMDTQGWVSFSGALWYPVAVGMDGSTKNLWIFGGNSVSRVGDLPFFATPSHPEPIWCRLYPSRETVTWFRRFDPIPQASTTHAEQRKCQCNSQTGWLGMGMWWLGNLSFYWNLRNPDLISLSKNES